MKRREAIRNLSLGIGYVVSAPAVLGVLESCSKKASPSWRSVFLNEEQKHVVEHLVDVILPATDIPGGLDLNLPEFVDKMCADLLTEVDKDWFNKGSELFGADIRTESGKDIIKSERQDVLDIFERYFKVDSTEQARIFKLQQKEEAELADQDLDPYALYRFLFVVREFTLLGYCTSEKIGKEVLVFDPIPGGFKPCIPLSEVGNAWTIDT